MHIKHINKSSVRGQDVSSQEYACTSDSKPGAASQTTISNRTNVEYRQPIFTCQYFVHQSDFWSTNVSADLALKFFHSSGVVFLITRLYQSSDLIRMIQAPWRCDRINGPMLRWMDGSNWFNDSWLVNGGSWSVVVHCYWFCSQLRYLCCRHGGIGGIPRFDRGSKVLDNVRSLPTKIQKTCLVFFSEQTPAVYGRIGNDFVSSHSADATE